MNHHRCLLTKLINFKSTSLLVVFFLLAITKTVSHAQKTDDFRDTIPSRSQMIDFATLSSTVYENDSNIEKRWPTGYEAVGFVTTDDGTQVWVLKKNGIPTIAFRGTDETKDWYTNLDLDREKPKMQGAEGKTHSGFQESLFKKQRKNLQMFLTRLKKTKGGPYTTIKNGIVADQLEKMVLREGMSSELHVTGHSLGGALSMVMASYMAAKYPRVKVTMVTFGAPRVGSKDWRTWANSKKNLRMFRYSYKTDLVARIPPPGTYQHAGHTIWIWEGSSTPSENGSFIYYLHDGCDAAGDRKDFCKKNELVSKPKSWNCKLLLYSNSNLLFTCKS